MLTHFLVDALGQHHAAQAARILGAALDAADPRKAVVRALKRNGDQLELDGALFDLSRRRVRVVGAGKAALAMTRGQLDVLGDRVEGGTIITKHAQDDGDPLPVSIRVLTGAHPVPAEVSVTATRALAETLSDSTQDDLVFALISGGGSALMTPRAGSSFVLSTGSSGRSRGAEV